MRNQKVCEVLTLVYDHHGHETNEFKYDQHTLTTSEPVRFPMPPWASHGSVEPLQGIVLRRARRAGAVGASVSRQCAVHPKEQEEQTPPQRCAIGVPRRCRSAPQRHGSNCWYCWEMALEGSEPAGDFERHERRRMMNVGAPALMPHGLFIMVCHGNGCRLVWVADYG